MRLCISCLSIIAALAHAAVSHCLAQTLVQRSFDIVFEGDDPGEVFTFELPFNLTVPSAIRFTGFFENLTTEETGVRYEYWWPQADGTFDEERFGIGFTRLPPAGRLSVEFDQSVGFTPDKVLLHVEGGGPSDHFRFVGDFAIDQVPEPAPGALIGAGALLGSCGRRRRLHAKR